MENTDNIENRKGLLASAEAKKEIAKKEDEIKVPAEINQTEKKVPAEVTPAKKNKPEKKVSAKKLPKIYRKKYNSKKFKKKLLKKLYVPEDKAFVQNLFIEDEATGILTIPMDSEFNKKDVARLKRISKEIRAQKGVVKLAPLIAVVVLCAVIGMAVYTLKNIVVKKAVVAGMQNVFNAKTDLNIVDFKIFDASLRLKGLAQASSSNPMKNIFEIGDIHLNFNLTEMLRGKAHIENITVADIAWNTDRKVSGELPNSKRKEKNDEPNIFEVKTQQLVADVQKKLTETFAEYNPKNIVEELHNNLQSPTVANEIGVSVHEKVLNWMAVPDEVRVVITDFSNSVQDVINTDWSRSNDLNQLRANLTTVNSAIAKGNNLKTEMNLIMQRIQSDATDVVSFSKKIANAVQDDRALVEKQVNKISDLKTKGIEGIISDMISTAIYSLAGEYYPYVEKGLAYANEIKAKSDALSAKKEKTKKKSVVVRAPGRDIYWKVDTVPKFLLEKLYTSGPNFEVKVNDVSSNMDQWGKPAVLDGKLSLLGHDNSVGLTVDTRNAATYLVSAKYGGTNFPVGVSFPAFGMASNSGISANFSAGANGAIRIGGVLDMSQVKFTTQEFEPKILYNIYQKALNTLDELSVGFDLSRAANSDFSLKLDTNADEIFLPKLLELFKQETLAIVNETKNRLFDEIEKYTGDITDKIAEFTGIEIDVRNLNVRMNNTQEKLDQTQKVLTERISKLAGNAAQNLLDQTLSDDVKNSPLGTILDKTIGSEKTESMVNKGLNSLFDAMKKNKN